MSLIFDLHSAQLQVHLVDHSTRKLLVFESWYAKKQGHLIHIEINMILNMNTYFSSVQIIMQQSYAIRS